MLLAEFSMFRKEKFGFVMQHQCCLLNVIFPSVLLSSVTVWAGACVQSRVRSCCTGRQWASKLFLYNVMLHIFLKGTVDTIWTCLYSFQWPGKWIIPFSVFGIPSTIDLPLFNLSYFISYIYLLVLLEFCCLTQVSWKFREI